MQEGNSALIIAIRRKLYTVPGVISMVGTTILFPFVSEG